MKYMNLQFKLSYLFLLLSLTLLAQDIRVIDNKGTLKHISSSIQSWVLTNSYVDGQFVENNNNIYRSNDAIGANTPFLIGETGATWRLVSASIDRTIYASSPTTVDNAHSNEKIQIESSGSLSIDGTNLLDGFSCLILNHSGSNSTITFSNFNDVFDLNRIGETITTDGDFLLKPLESVFVTVNIDFSSNRYLNIHRFSGFRSVTNEHFFDGNDDSNSSNDDYYYISMLVDDEWKVIQCDKTDVNEDKVATVTNNSGQLTQPTTLAACTNLNYN